MQQDSSSSLGTPVVLIQDAPESRISADEYTTFANPRNPSERVLSLHAENCTQWAHLHNLRSQNFDTVIFDYDGTLCSPAERFVGPGKGITAGLNRLLDAGLYIGIATGRGRSARRDLALRIHRHQWDRVLLAYYNGAEIGHLGMENCPDATESPAGDFSLALDALAADTQLRNACTFSVRPRQITLEARSDISGDRIWMLATECLRRASLEHIRVVTSTHSVEIGRASCRER